MCRASEICVVRRDEFDEDGVAVAVQNISCPTKTRNGQLQVRKVRHISSVPSGLWGMKACITGIAALIRASQK